jgi:hypothetical protein
MSQPALADQVLTVQPIASPNQAPAVQDAKPGAGLGIPVTGLGMQQS